MTEIARRMKLRFISTIKLHEMKHLIRFFLRERPIAFEGGTVFPVKKEQSDF